MSNYFKQVYSLNFGEYAFDGAQPYMAEEIEIVPTLARPLLEPKLTQIRR